MRDVFALDGSLDRDGTMSLAEQNVFRRGLVGAFADLLVQMSDDNARHTGEPIDQVFGQPQAMTGFTLAAAIQSRMSALWGRVPEPGKTYGQHMPIEGRFEPGQTVIMADDVVTDGRSKREGFNDLRQAWLRPAGVALLFDRQEGGAQWIENTFQIPVKSFTDLSRALTVLSDNDLIGQRELDQIALYHQSLKDSGVKSTVDVEKIKFYNDILPTLDPCVKSALEQFLPACNGAVMNRLTVIANNEFNQNKGREDFDSEKFEDYLVATLLNGLDYITGKDRPNYSKLPGRI
ncbi:MAG: hypothetical protein LBM73_01325 [Candidatus Nomurabacteria bacterium]|jgi:orotate phosphoribosyltransferase|nr:hypothetical protein [Candidatus Nomurabacteria bacterium]